MPAFAIARPRVEQLIDAHPERRVVLVHGPAGAGKTILVAQWVAPRPDRCCWLTITTSYDDPQVLRRHLAEHADLLPDEVDLGLPPVDPDLDDDALRYRLEALARHRGAPIDLVLDGVDRLRRRSQRVVARLVERPPDAVRVILVARSKAHLGIERARLRGDLVEVGPYALRFHRSEIDALAATWTGRSVDVAGLEQATLGWAAGLRLAQLATADDGATPAALRDPDGVAVEYIREELIEGSAPDLRAFLEVTCWLPVVTAPLCAAVAGKGSQRPLLTLSEMQALPLLPVASRPGAFRYPPVLSEALQHEYRRRDHRAATRALCRAAEALRRCGELATAIELYLQAGRVDEAADACADLAGGGESSLARVDDLFRRRPELAPEGARWLPWRIRAAVMAGRVAEASLLLRRLPESTSAGDQPDAVDDQGHVLARAAVAEHVGDVTTMLGCAERLMGIVGRPRRWTHAELTARCWRIRALVWSGETARAKDELGRLVASSSTRAEAAAPLALARAWVAWFDGDVGLVGDLVAPLEQQGHDDHRAELALLVGSAHREANRLAHAAVRLQEACGHAHNVVASLAASELARCRRAAGAPMEALELVISTRSSCAGLPPAVDVHLRATEALVRLDSGDVVGAHVVVRGAQASVDAQLLAARIALRQSPGRAAELLEAVVVRTGRQAIERLLLRAQLPNAEPAEVSVALIKAVSMGGPLGLVRTFLDEGPAVCRLFPDLAAASSDRALGRIAALACEELAHMPDPATLPPLEQLTARELAVLQMLPLRLSNQEMADQMYISVNTLKTHVRAIYRKLDVPHRSAAVRRAKALELV